MMKQENTDGRIISSGLMVTMKEMIDRKLELADVLVNLLDRDINSGRVYFEVINQYHELNDEIAKRNKINQ